MATMIIVVVAVVVMIEAPSRINLIINEFEYHQMNHNILVSL